MASDPAAGQGLLAPSDATRRHVATRSSLARAECQDDAIASSLLDRAIYSYADVDRLVGLHAGTARRWLEGYERLARS